VLSRLRGTARDDAGFTLIELLVVITLLGVIVVPLAGAVMAFLRDSDVTTARMSESHDAQLATAYFAQDVQAVGVRDYTVTGSAYFPLRQSVEIGVPAAGGLYPCGNPALPAAVVRLAWDDFAQGAASSAVQMRVAYVVENGSELHRVLCAGSATPVSDIRIARNLAAPSLAVTCTDGSGTPVACTGSGPATPASVSLALTLHDPQSPAGSTYTVTLTGQRRQS
jgi:prepilin-type N-terminal cleavage/methylation domain-containing protein